MQINSEGFSGKAKPHSPLGVMASLCPTFADHTGSFFSSVGRLFLTSLYTVFVCICMHCLYTPRPAELWNGGEANSYSCWEAGAMDLTDRNYHDLNNKQREWGAWINYRFVGRHVGLVIKMQTDTMSLVWVACRLPLLFHTHINTVSCPVYAKHQERS